MKIDEPKTPYHHDNGTLGMLVSCYPCGVSFQNLLIYFYLVEGDEDGEREVMSPPEGDSHFLEHWEEFHNAMEKVHHKQQKTSAAAATVDGRESRGSPSQSTVSSARRRSTGSSSDMENDRSTSGGETSGSESDSDRKHFKKEEFIKRRKAHYNEFLVFKTLREHDPDEEAALCADEHSLPIASASSNSAHHPTPAPAAVSSSSSSPLVHNNNGSVSSHSAAGAPLQQRSTSSPALSSKIKKDPGSTPSATSPGGRRSGKGIGFALPPGSGNNT
jgi:hypothetical protein